MKGRIIAAVGFSMGAAFSGSPEMEPVANQAVAVERDVSFYGVGHELAPDGLLYKSGDCIAIFTPIYGGDGSEYELRFFGLSEYVLDRDKYLGARASYSPAMWDGSIGHTNDAMMLDEQGEIVHADRSDNHSFEDLTRHACDRADKQEQNRKLKILKLQW